MKAKLTGMRRLAGALSAGVATAMIGAQAFAAEELLGQPTPGAMGLQVAASPLKHHAHFFHNAILLPLITVISLFVLGLLLWCVVRYNKRSNPVPARWSHNTAIEIIWTVVPVGILLAISVFSFKLLFDYHDMPKPYATVKATGYQWYWGYEYPDQKIAEITSVMLPEAEAKAKGVPFRLGATEPMVVPVNQVIRVQVTGADVIHAFAVPAFGVITDAVPGRLNEVWFKAEKVGTYYGQCRELCGVDHAFMPIEVKVVSQQDFDAWVAAKAPPPAPAETAVAAAPAAPAQEIAAAPASAPLAATH